MDKLDDKYIINIFLDKEFKFNHLVDPMVKIEDIKSLILEKLGLYSLNYKMEYNDHDIGGFDTWTLKHMFLFSKKDEFDIYLTLNSTLKKYEKQTVLISYIEGDCWIILYKILSMKWLKVCPTMSSSLSFYDTMKFPYNSRSCHVLQENQIVITGGVNHEYQACYYDADTNAVVSYPNMKHPRQRHSMIYCGYYKVFIIGGAGSKKVTRLDTQKESYTEFPDMNYTRKDASLCYVNERYLYVFMGYVDEIGGVSDNYEKIDVIADPFTEKWKLLPLNNYYGLNMPRTYCGISFVKNDGCFYLFGGSHNATSQASVIKFTEGDYVLQKSSYNLPFGTCFSETFLLQRSEVSQDYYLFAYGGDHELILFNPKKKILKEIPQEWLY